MLRRLECPVIIYGNGGGVAGTLSRRRRRRLRNLKNFSAIGEGSSDGRLTLLIIISC